MYERMRGHGCSSHVTFCPPPHQTDIAGRETAASSSSHSSLLFSLCFGSISCLITPTT